jgi:hypothetical protein
MRWLIQCPPTGLIKVDCSYSKERCLTSLTTFGNRSIQIIINEPAKIWCILFPDLSAAQAVMLQAETMLFYKVTGLIR